MFTNIWTVEIGINFFGSTVNLLSTFLKLPSIFLIYNNNFSSDSGWTPVMNSVFHDHWETVDMMLSINLSQNNESKKLLNVISSLRHKTWVSFIRDDFEAEFLNSENFEAISVSSISLCSKWIIRIYCLGTEKGIERKKRRTSVWLWN